MYVHIICALISFIYKNIQIGNDRIITNKTEIVDLNLNCIIMLITRCGGVSCVCVDFLGMYKAVA